MNIVTGVIAVFSVIGVLDRIFGNRFGLGKEFERGFEMLGTLTFAMLGMIVIQPVIASWLQPALNSLPVEPSMVMSALFACDSGGTHLAAQVAHDPVMGYYNGLIVASMIGYTVSFTIFPVSVAFVFTDHLAFTIAFQSGYLISMIVGKLISAALAVIVAGVVYNKVYKGE